MRGVRLTVTSLTVIVLFAGVANAVQIRDLAHHPQATDPFVEQRAHTPEQLAHAVHVGRLR